MELKLTTTPDPDSRTGYMAQADGLAGYEVTAFGQTGLDAMKQLYKTLEMAVEIELELRGHARIDW